jgi:hypothetical protein
MRIGLIIIDDQDPRGPQYFTSVVTPPVLAMFGHFSGIHHLISRPRISIDKRKQGIIAISGRCPSRSNTVDRVITDKKAINIFQDGSSAFIRNSTFGGT